MTVVGSGTDRDILKIKRFVSEPYSVHYIQCYLKENPRLRYLRWRLTYNSVRK